MFAVIILKFKQRGLSIEKFVQLANSADPDQTAPRAVCSGSALFAKACLSENLGSLK